jgi:CelD/BcsL family acetyltransferase involved in cellulose biosynthesis
MRVGLAGTLRVEQMPVASMLAVLRNHPVLIQAMRYPNFFASVSWLDTVFQCGSAAEAFALVVYRADVPVAALPLETTCNWLGGSDLRYLGYRFFPDPLGLICAERDLAEATAALTGYLQCQSRWDRLILDFLLPEEAACWSGKLQQQSVAPCLGLPGSIETLLAGFRGEKRYRLRSKAKRAEDAGMTFAVAHTVDEKREYLDALFRLHAVRSSAIGRDSSIRNREVQSLHVRLVGNCDEACLFALQAEGRPVAVLYGFLCSRRFSFFQIAHDPRFDQRRPGTVLLYRTIAWLCEAGAIEFNFLQGDERYKFEWTADARQLLQMEARLSPVRSRLLAGARCLRRWGVDQGKALVNAFRD